jgi:Flp pilus assembly protein CpaB
MDPRRRARLILILGVLLALVAAIATYSVASSSGSAPPERPTADVVVAARDIPARTEITEADVKVVKIDLTAAPPSAVADTKKVVGQILIQSVAQGEPILASKFAPSDRTFTVFPAGEQLQAGSPSYRIMTIAVADGDAVGGILVPGDAVDVMFVFQFDPTKYIEGAGPAGAVTATAAPQASPSRTLSPKAMTDQVAKIILGPMKILARAANVYTIRVDAPLAEEIAYLQAAGGTLKFLLRAPGDERDAGTTGATFKNVFDKFHFPIPERIPAPSPTP